MILRYFSAKNLCACADSPQGKDLIFTGIRNFIANSPRTKRSDTSRGTTFHETMT
jgi:hypothetical protein